MKITIDTKLFAVMNSTTFELVPRYTGGFFWTRKGDALNKLSATSKKGRYEMITCSINIIDSLNSEAYINEAKLRATEKVTLERIRNEQITKLKNELKELTGLSDIPTIKTFLVKNLLIPDYKVQIENTLNNLGKLNCYK